MYVQQRIIVMLCRNFSNYNCMLSRMYWKKSIGHETEKERLLLCYQVNFELNERRKSMSHSITH